MMEGPHLRVLMSRTHANGRGAEVCQQNDGRYTAREWPAPSERTRTRWFHENIRTLEGAQALADNNAHPDCDGRCMPWLHTPALPG